MSWSACRWCDLLFGGEVLTPGELGAIMTPATRADGGSTLTCRGSGYGLGLWVGRTNGLRVAWHAGSTAPWEMNASTHVSALKWLGVSERPPRAP